jgi:mannose-6-phosphate isomerase-like protein (cupin superfamily)
MFGRSAIERLRIRSGAEEQTRAAAAYDGAVSVTEGDGYSIGNIDDLGQGPGFRKIRRELGVSEFGVNAIVLPARWETSRHLHERQQELYFVHSGELEVEFEDGSVHTLGPGGLARVDAATVRRFRNRGDQEAVYVVIGAHGGYVGRDGLLPEGDDPAQRGGRPIADE